MNLSLGRRKLVITENLRVVLLRVTTVALLVGGVVEVKASLKNNKPAYEAYLENSRRRSPARTRLTYKRSGMSQGRGKLDQKPRVVHLLVTMVTRLSGGEMCKPK